MKPIMFKGTNRLYAKNQAEYLSLPALHRTDGTVITQWQLSWAKRFKIFFTGKLWLTQLTFNEPFQPQRPSLIIYDDMLPEKSTCENPNGKS